MTNAFITFNQLVPRMPEPVFGQPINWQIHWGEVWAITGANGSGKSILAEVLSGRFIAQSGEIVYHFIADIKQNISDSHTLWPDQYIKTIQFQSVYSLADFRQMYYQQRFNSTEAENSPSVTDLFDSESLDFLTKQTLFSRLNIQKLLNRRLIHLSSGELRRLIIAKSLTEKPRMMIFDNPFIGLDTKARHEVDEMLTQLGQMAVQLLFICPSVVDLPSCTTHQLHLEKGTIQRLDTIMATKAQLHKIKTVPIDWHKIPMETPTVNPELVQMKNIDITYGETLIQQDLNWTIHKGEKWALLGPNGSGKSTLLSYIFADNPQAYAKDISLFGKKRGTGESIWDIKKRIGYTSSEMHLYYREPVSCLKVVESGFFDSIGLFRNCSSEQQAIAQYLMEQLGIAHLAGRLFLKISSGEQRIVLFARALVKNPELLILDEPFHGLDDQNKAACQAAIESFSFQPDKSLIFVTHQKEEIPSCIDYTKELQKL